MVECRGRSGWRWTPAGAARSVRRQAHEIDGDCIFRALFLLLMMLLLMLLLMSTLLLL